MDDHTRRVTQRLRVVWADFQSGRATLLDLQAAASLAVGALDNAHADLLRLLRAADGELEHALYASEQQHHSAAGERIFAPILKQLDRE